MKKQITLLVLASALIATNAFAGTSLNANPINVTVTTNSEANMHAYAPGGGRVLISSGQQQGTLTVPAGTQDWNDASNYSAYNSSLTAQCTWQNGTIPTTAPATIDMAVTINNNNTNGSCVLVPQQ